MEFGVLGPVVMNDGGISHLPSAPKTRQILALLLLNANTPVPASVCIEELWGTQAPRSAVQTLHTYILHIRRALAGCPSVTTPEQPKQILVTKHQGYQICVEQGALDLHHYERHMNDARAAQASGDDQRLAASLRAALAVWRGPTLVDVPAGPRLEARIAGLEETRLTTFERCVEAELRLGLHHGLLGELRALTADHPTHENLHAQYMLALYRSGRVAQALDVYHTLREKLNNELGLEPSPRLRHLQTAMLAANPALGVETAPDAALSLDLLAPHGAPEGLEAARR
ncbi:AfsR/SARP family transcriptional regulator [Streptomyces griseus]|uniref:AfsR/SARP family transcriptional regulator n=1 Tax=Streptomyces griseus TaxID=1911 RepID=UPI0007C7454A|nr:AfsR/SARP family transcriptional regulator [Streptomyces griseus]